MAKCKVQPAPSLRGEGGGGAKGDRMQVGYFTMVQEKRNNNVWYLYPHRPPQRGTFTAMDLPHRDSHLGGP